MLAGSVPVVAIWLPLSTRPGEVGVEVCVNVTVPVEPDTVNGTLMYDELLATSVLSNVGELVPAAEASVAVRIVEAKRGTAMRNATNSVARLVPLLIRAT